MPIVTEEPQEYKDEELLTRSLGNPAYFKLIVEKYQAPCLRTAFRVVKNREDAEDVVQDAMVRIYRNAEKFKTVEGATFKSWAYRILINTSINVYNKRKRERVAVVSVDSEVYENTIAAHDEDIEYRVHVKHLVETSLAMVPEHLRSVLKKYYLEEKSQNEIAKEEGSTVSSVKMKLFRARKYFKRIVEENKNNKNALCIANAQAEV